MSAASTPDDAQTRAAPTTENDVNLWFDTGQALPSDAGLDPIHDREYRVRAYRLSAERILIRGAVRDQKPPGLYISYDPDPITVHHMVVEMEVAFPALQIERAEVVFETFPHETCGSITDHYRQLEGLPIARGFSSRVRELFGGPRGCTHTTALLLAMGPVAVQCAWSMRCWENEPGDVPTLRIGSADGSLGEAWKMNADTCHEWAVDGGVAYAQAARGEPWGVPVFLRDRVAALDVDTGMAE